MSELNDFPAEISSQILGNLHIDDIFRARLVSRSFRAFVDQHIDLVAYQIARQDFPHARLLLDQPPGSKYDLPWLRTLIPRRLAAIVLDKHRIHRQHSASSYVLHIPAEDDYGDEPRARLTRAWCLLKRINDIHHLAAQPATRERPDYQPLDLPTVHARALELVKSLTPDQCKNFALLAYLVLSAFVDADIDAGDWRRHLTFTVAGQDEPVRFLDCAPRLQAVNESRGHFGFARAPAEGARKTVAVNSRHPDRGNSWVCAFLLREGADAFHRQWIVGAGGENYGNESKEREYVADRLIEQWGLRTPKEIHKERECASRIWYAFIARARSSEVQEFPLVPPPNWNSLYSPSNDYAFPTIDLWLRERRKERQRQQSHTLYAWYIWQQERMVNDAIRNNRQVNLIDDSSEEMDSLQDVPYTVSFRTV